MKIGDNVFVHGYVDEIRRDTVIIRNKGGCFETDASEVSENVSTREKGTWIHLIGDEWRCSQCGNVIHTEGSWVDPLMDECKMYYCNICGAEMYLEEPSEE